MLDVEQWAEIRRMSRVDGFSQRKIAKELGVNRRTVKRALGSSGPPVYGPRAKRPSKLDPFLGEIERLLNDNHSLSGVRVFEEIEALGYDGGMSILLALLRELRPRFAPFPRTFQHTVYRPGELAQIDLVELREPVPVGFGQVRKGFLVTFTLPFSKLLAAELVFSKTLEDITFGISSCLRQVGMLPGKLVLDREGALHRGGGNPSDGFATFLGQLDLGWIILGSGDAEAKGALERIHRFVHGNFEAGRTFASPEDLRHRLDRWRSKVNSRVHRSTNLVVIEHFGEEKPLMRPLPKAMPDTAWRQTVRVPPQPYFRFDRSDYSLDPRLVGQRVEIRADQRWVTATELDTGRLACRHERVFAGGITLTDPAHQKALDELRHQRLRGTHPASPDVEIRPLTTYDSLIPA